MSKKFQIIQIAVLTLLMLFISGCGSVRITEPQATPKAHIPMSLYQPSKIDFSKRAKSEKEASDMVWELYLYIMELNYGMEALNNGQ